MYAITSNSYSRRQSAYSTFQEVIAVKKVVS